MLYIKKFCVKLYDVSKYPRKYRVFRFIIIVFLSKNVNKVYSGKHYFVYLFYSSVNSQHFH